MMKIITKRLEEIVNEFLEHDFSEQTEEEKAKQAQTVHDKLHDIFMKFVHRHQNEDDEIVMAYFDYLKQYENPEFRSTADLQVLRRAMEEVFPFILTIELASRLLFIKMTWETDVVIEQMRSCATSYYNHPKRGEAEVVAKAASELLALLEQHIHNQQALHLKLTEQYERSGKDLSFYIEDWYEEELATRTFDSLLFFITQFGISEALTKNDDELDFSEKLSQLERGGLATKLQEKSRAAFQNLNNWQQVCAKMLEIAEDFRENESRRSAPYAVETINKLIDILGEFLWAQIPAGDVNGSVIAFGSFLYQYQRLCQEDELEVYFGGELDMDCLYAYVEDEATSNYLEQIEKGDWDKALAINDCYEFPYYMKLLRRLEKIKSIRDIADLTEKDRELIYACHRQLDLDGLYFYLAEGMSGEYLCALSDLNPDFPDYEAFMKIVEYQSTLEDKNRQLQQLHDKNTRMVNEFTHSWINILHPEVVENVIKVLSENDAYQTEVDDLIRAYNGEIMIQQEASLLKLRHSGSPDQLKRVIRKGIAGPDSVSCGVFYLVRKSVELVLFRALYKRNDDRAEFIRKRLSGAGVDLDGLIHSFKNEVLGRHMEDEAFLQWFNLHAVPFRLTHNEDWANVRIKPSSETAAMLIEVFTELMVNALTHGAYAEGQGIELVLASLKAEEIQYLTIMMANPVDTDQAHYQGSEHQGLMALKESLTMLNSDDNPLSRSPEVLNQTKQDNLFKVNVWIRQNLLIRKGR